MKSDHQPIIIYWSDEHGKYVANAYEVGLTGVGESREEALETLLKVIELMKPALDRPRHQLAQRMAKDIASIDYEVKLRPETYYTAEMQRSNSPDDVPFDYIVPHSGTPEGTEDA